MSASSLIASPIRSIGPAPALGIAMRRGIAFGLVAALIWGSYMAISNHGIEAGLRPADLAFIRYSVAGLLLLPWLVRHVPLHLGGKGWRKGLTLSLFAGPLFVLVGTSGYRFAPLAHGAVIQLGALTVASVLLASALIGERAGRRRLAGLSVIIAGLGVTAGPSLFAGGSTAWIGDLLFVAAGIMWAFFTVLQRRWAIDTMAATAVVSVVSAAIYVPLYLSSQGFTRIAAPPPRHARRTDSGAGRAGRGDRAVCLQPRGTGSWRRTRRAVPDTRPGDRHTSRHSARRRCSHCIPGCRPAHLVNRHADSCNR